MQVTHIRGCEIFNFEAHVLQEFLEVVSIPVFGKHTNDKKKA